MESGVFRRLSRKPAKKLSSPAFPVADTLGIASWWLAGKVALAKSDPRAAIANLEKAVAAEAAMPYMEPSYWPLPVRPSLGAALLRAGEAVRAEEVFRADLKRWPRNAWGLLGLHESLRRQGKDESAALVRREFDAAWANSDVKLSLEWF